MKRRLIAILSLLIVAPSFAGLPDPGMQIDLERTALVVTDPQNDFLSPKGVAWGVVGESVTENKTVEHIEQLFRSAKVPEGDGYAAALVNFRFIANSVKTTAEVKQAIEALIIERD